MISEVDWKELAPYLPPTALTLVGVYDLPEQMARAFTEKDGTRGRIVYITPKEGRSVWDGRYLELWAEGAHRLHDRARWKRVIAPAGDGRFQAEPWQHERLQP